MSLISAIITTHNRLGLLKRAIASVLSQTYSDIECIVVDDASTDGTMEYCQSLTAIKYIRISPHESRGGNYARNLGIKSAQGEYVAFLDDDDYWLPQKISKQILVIENNDCELVHCGRRIEHIKSGHVVYSDLLPNPLDKGDMSQRIFQTIATTTSCILVSRAALVEIGLFDENLKFWQEYELTIRLAQRKPFCYVNEALCVYRLDENDKNRLTNKYYQWEDAVRYIYQKHRALYLRLSPVGKVKCHINVWTDAYFRCRALKIRHLQWLYYILFVFGRVFNKLF